MVEFCNESVVAYEDIIQISP